MNEFKRRTKIYCNLILPALWIISPIRCNYSFFLKSMKANLRLLLVFMVAISACKKDHINNQILPPETRSGKNTIGFSLNGQVWLPYYTCTLGSDPCGKISARYGTGFGGPANNIDFSFTRRANCKFSFLQIFPKISSTCTITTIGNKIDSLSVAYFSDKGNNFATLLH